MYEVFYYIFAAMTLVFCLLTAFSDRAESSVNYFAVFIFAFCGLIVLLNSPLIALVILLLTFIKMILLILFSKQSSNAGEAHDTRSYSYLVLTGIFAALLTSLVSSTRIHQFEIDFSAADPSLIFSVYLPVIILIAVVVSAILPQVLPIFKKEDNT
jgi:hypothetical protein